MSAPLYDVVIPTIGRLNLAPLVSSLLAETADAVGRVVVVDDRPEGEVTDPLALRVHDRRVRVHTSGGRGPAAARNVGIRATNAPWVVFIDDDVELSSGWGEALARDLRTAPRAVGGIQAEVRVPLPSGPLTDWQRNVAALAGARWITAEMAYRRSALLATGGFDERFHRAYREDSDLALRVCDAGWQLRFGDRVVRHPVGGAPWWISVAKQRGNFDDARMTALHGRGWRDRGLSEAAPAEPCR